MSKLLSLDAVGVGLGGEVRQARRAVVVRAKELMRDFDQLRARALHLVRSGLHSALDKAINIASEANHDTAIATPNLESVDIASATSMDTSTVDFDEVSSETDSGSDTNMDADQVAEESDQEEEEDTSGPALNPSLRYHPRFEEQRVNGGVILSAHVPGVSQKDLECSLDTESRTLKVRGIRHVRTWMGDSYRWFEQEFSLPSSLTTNAENVQVRLTRATLQIFVPYAAPPVKSHAQKRYYQPSSQSFASPERLFASRRGGFGSFAPFGLAW
jgi:HSP20 family molecular chaperone IbpA